MCIRHVLLTDLVVFKSPQDAENEAEKHKRHRRDEHRPKLDGEKRRLALIGSRRRDPRHSVFPLHYFCDDRVSLSLIVDTSRSIIMTQVPYLAPTLPRKSPHLPTVPTVLSSLVATWFEAHLSPATLTPAVLTARVECHASCRAYMGEESGYWKEENLAALLEGIEDR